MNEELSDEFTASAFSYLDRLFPDGELPTHSPDCGCHAHCLAALVVELILDGREAERDERRKLVECLSTPVAVWLVTREIETTEPGSGSS